MGNASLIFRAGKNALQQIRDNGLTPEMVQVIAGAAGGPKWFVLRHLDQSIFLSWMAKRSSPLFLIGSSIGSWRFAAVSQGHAADAMEAFEEAYASQCYTHRPTAAEVTATSRGILDQFLEDDAVDTILSHPFYRLNVMTVKSRQPVASDRPPVLAAGLAGAFFSNMIRRRLLGKFFERALFYDPRDIPPFFQMNGFPITRTPLTRNNLKPALLASGSIPLLMEGVSGMPDAPKGVYRDGGIIDYHLDVPLNKGDQGIVLYPHYLDRVIPGWFDKALSWRHPSPDHMDNVLLLSPSPDFVRRLPHGKIPDRSDFKTFYHKDKDRIAYWKRTVNQSRELGDAFMDAVSSGRIRDLVVPLF